MKDLNNKISRYIVSGVLMLVTGVCFALLKLFSKEYVDVNGVLHEQFYLIPLSYLFLGLGVVVLIIAMIKYYFKKIVFKKMGNIFRIERR